MNILLTGAGGRLGTGLARYFIQETEHTVLALGRDRAALCRTLEAAGAPPSDRLECRSNDEFLASGFHPAGAEQAVIHLAFGRHSRGPAEIAASLPFMDRVLHKLEELPSVRRAVYVSTQAVYGSAAEFRRADATPPAPELPYAMAKYAGEVLFTAYARRRPAVSAVILRLDAVVQSQNLVPALCRSAVRDRRLVIRGGGQCVSCLDQEDAVRAIALAALSDPAGVPLYNVGPHRMRVTLAELADIVRDVAARHGQTVAVETVPADIVQWAGMDAAPFQRDYGWQPRRDLRAMVTDIYEDALRQYTSSQGGQAT